jgi:hypothetical protein
LLLIAGAVQADNAGRIYGKIHTVDGDTFEGLIRWDKNEGSWVDLLNGTRDRDERDRDRKYESSRRRYKSGSSRVRIFGIDISDDNDYFYLSGSSSSSGVRFGHLQSLKVLDDDRALLVLKSGHEVEFYNGSTDIGEGIREIVIEDPDEGEVEFTWDDIDLIEFSDTDFKGESTFGERLYGKLTTRRGDEFTGFVCWDVDELFENDVLDGDESRRSRKVRFGQIQSIARYSSSGAEVVMIGGDEMLLKGTNDVNDGNRGIIICDPGLGQVEVEWDDFERLEFSEAPAAVPYSKFDGGKKMTGTVYTEDGKEYTGEICWDDDEEYTWEILNGNVRDMEYSIEFGLIKEIGRDSRRASEVTLKDGRSFQLRGSNDVDDDNKGVIVTESKGQEVFVDWEDFSRVVFSH